jgi:hypothetical protein
MLNYIQKIVIVADPKNDQPSFTGEACPAASTLNGASGGEKPLINTGLSLQPTKGLIQGKIKNRLKRDKSEIWNGI